MQAIGRKCATINCRNLTKDNQFCPSCLAKEANQRLMPSVPAACAHTYSITGDLGMVQRLLPDYNGGPPQHGYMLDICKACLKELEERPYTPVPYRRERRIGN